jgi:hypothetical protein
MPKPIDGNNLPISFSKYTAWQGPTTANLSHARLESGWECKQIIYIGGIQHVR